MVHNRRQEEIKAGDWIVIYLNEKTSTILKKKVKIGKVLAWIINRKLNWISLKSLNPTLRISPAIALETINGDKKWYFISEKMIKKLKVNKKFSFAEAQSLEKLWPNKK